MCGFLGKVKVESSESKILHGLPWIRSRGPDSFKTWQSSDGIVELLHSRLAIVDKDSRSHQPLLDEKNGIAVVFTGEIYNYQELKRELNTYPFRTESDTEVFIASYVIRGMEGFKKLRGMFSACLVDTRRKKIYLVRDPVGKKPLYIAQWQDGFYFGTNVLGLVAISGRSQDLNLGQLESFWKEGYVDPCHSIFNDCTVVLPGQIKEFDWETRFFKTHSCTPGRIRSSSNASIPEICQTIDLLIKKAVDRRVANNPEPICLLSGGVDSVVVANYIKRKSHGLALSITSHPPFNYEEKYAKFAAKKIGIPLKLVNANKGKMTDDVIWALDLQDEPLGMQSFFPLALLIRTAKKYSRILITGDGGDEVFLGYGRPTDWLNSSNKKEPLEADDFLDNLFGLEAINWMSNWGRRVIGKSLIGHMFTKLDRASSEQGVEARCPLVDWDLMAYIRSLPQDVLFFNGEPKALLKAQLSGWPDKFVYRRKQGFPFALRWLWGLSNFKGLRDLVSEDATHYFEKHLPLALKKSPRHWTRFTILNNFEAIWKLLSWSRFGNRLKKASTFSP